MENISVIDAILIGILLSSTIFAVFRGLVRGVLGIISLITAYFVSKKYGGSLSQPLSVLIGESVFSVVLGYVMIFFIALLIFSVITHFINRSLSIVDLGSLNKFGGLFFGLLRGSLFSLILVTMLAALPLQNTNAWQKSILIPFWGQVINFTLQRKFAKDYQRYWKFDDEHRPRLSLFDLPKWKKNKGDDTQSTDIFNQKDDRLDQLSEEWDNAGSSSSEHVKKRIAENRKRKKEYSQSFSQQLRNWFAGLIQEDCEGASCGANK